MRYIVSFAEFWYDFIVGDDWLIAVVVAATLVVLALIAHNMSHPPALWWVLPVVVCLALGASLWRATRNA